MYLFNTETDYQRALTKAYKQVQSGTIDSYQILNLAESFGWHDPGYTEPMAEVVARATQFLTDTNANNGN